MNQALRRSGWFLLGICSMFGVIGCQASNYGGTAQAEVARELPLLGHRNWVVIADSAYPCQSRAGIGTIATNQDQLTLVKGILDEIDHTRHVRPKVYLDAELPHVADADAPGVAAYRTQLQGILKGRSVESLPHEQIISKLDQAGATFRVLIVKSNMTLPYTSVFVQLDCGYWSPEAEQRLRQSMPATQAATQATAQAVVPLKTPGDATEPVEPAREAVPKANQSAGGRRFTVEEFARVDPQMASLAKALADDQLRYNALTANGYGANHPAVISAQAGLDARTAALRKYADDLNERFVIRWGTDGTGGALVPRDMRDGNATR